MFISLSRFLISSASVTPCPSPDSIDTLAVMRHLKNLIRICNVYLNDQTAPPNCPLVETMATYCTKMLQMFGVIPSESRLGFSAEEGVEGGGVDVEGLVVPFASLLADFREEVRSVALQDKCEGRRVGWGSW